MAVLAAATAVETAVGAAMVSVRSSGVCGAWSRRWLDTRGACASVVRLRRVMGIGNWLRRIGWVRWQRSVVGVDMTAAVIGRW